MKTSDSIENVSIALVAALGELHNPDKDGTSHHGKYATLPAILNLVRPVLEKNQLALTQDPVSDEAGRVGCVTRIVHASGQWFEYGPFLLPGGNNAQAAGSAETYARRYVICAVLGIAADEDDDGAAASKRESRGGESAPYGEGGADENPPDSCAHDFEVSKAREGWLRCKKCGGYKEAS